MQLADSSQLEPLTFKAHILHRESEELVLDEYDLTRSPYLMQLIAVVQGGPEAPEKWIRIYSEDDRWAVELHSAESPEIELYGVFTQIELAIGWANIRWSQERQTV